MGTGHQVRTHGDLLMTHASTRISGLRSVSLCVPDLNLAEDFFTRVWHLRVAERDDHGIYLSATGADHHVVSLHPEPGPARLRDVTLRAHRADLLQSVAQSALDAGGQVLQAPGPVLEPGGGTAVTVADPDGRVFRVVHGDRLTPAPREEADHPIRLAHVVLNACDVAAAQKFMEQVFDFSLSDRTRIMAFMRCNSDHHSIALADADNAALNHIAFVMPSLDDVMRGGGRMKEAGYPIEWGPGRHGPGHNAFNYFVGPFDVVIEYTAEVQQIDDSYRTGRPEDWTWPPGRVDHWGISTPPSARLKQAQKSVLFKR
jgi:predicted enzyme related to lactoylglutathione lyase